MLIPGILDDWDDWDGVGKLLGWGLNPKVWCLRQCLAGSPQSNLRPMLSASSRGNPLPGPHQRQNPCWNRGLSGHFWGNHHLLDVSDWYARMPYIWAELGATTPRTFSSVVCLQSRLSSFGVILWLLGDHNNGNNMDYWCVSGVNLIIHWSWITIGKLKFAVWAVSHDSKPRRLQLTFFSGWCHLQSEKPWGRSSQQLYGGLVPNGSEVLRIWGWGSASCGKHGIFGSESDLLVNTGLLNYHKRTYYLSFIIVNVLLLLKSLLQI